MEITDIPSKDEFDVDSATKDELIAFAFAHFGKEINGRLIVKDIKEQVVNLLNGMDEDDEQDQDTTDAGVDYSYCLNPLNKRVLIASPGMRRLVKQGDLVPCDKSGKRL